MARRRKRNKKKVNTFAFPVPFASFVVMAVAFALVYVWIGIRCEAVGREIKTLEAQRKVLEKRYLNEEYRWTRMKSPRNLERILRQRNIVMSWPRRDQVVRLDESYDYKDRYARLDRVVMNE